MSVSLLSWLRTRVQANVGLSDRLPPAGDRKTAAWGQKEAVRGHGATGEQQPETRGGPGPRSDCRAAATHSPQVLWAAWGATRTPPGRLGLKPRGISTRVNTRTVATMYQQSSDHLACMMACMIDDGAQRVAAESTQAGMSEPVLLAIAARKNEEGSAGSGSGRGVTTVYSTSAWTSLWKSAP